MINRRRRERPKSKEKRRQCRNCGYRTTHVFDNGMNRFICSECELK